MFTAQQPVSKGLKPEVSAGRPSHTSSKGILENLLKTKKLEAVKWSASVAPETSLHKDIDIHGQVDGRVKSQTTLVRAQGRVELYSEAAVHLQLAIVVLPHDAELNHALWDGGDGQGGAVLGVLAEEGAVLEGAGELYADVSN